MNRRPDVACGLLVSTVLHAAVLAAAGSYLVQRGSSEEPAAEPRPALEVVLVEREAFESELEPDPLRLPLELVRIQQAQRRPEPLEWPRLDVAPTLPSPRVLPVRAPREDLSDPEHRALDEFEHPRASPLLQAVEPPRTDADPSPTTAEPRDPTPIGEASALVLYRPPLRYPPRALQRGIEGVTRVGVEVVPNGTVARAWILGSSGNRSLDRVALAYLEGFVFDSAAVAAAGRGNSFSMRVRFAIE